MIKIKGMCTLVIILWVLCVGVVNIVTGQEPEVEKLGHNKLNFGYGINFKYNGEVHNNLDRVWVVKRFNLPKELHLSFRGLSRSSDLDATNACGYVLRLQVRGSKWLGCHAGCQEVGRCRTRGESEE